MVRLPLPQAGLATDQAPLERKARIQGRICDHHLGAVLSGKVTKHENHSHEHDLKSENKQSLENEINMRQVTAAEVQRLIRRLRCWLPVDEIARK